MRRLALIACTASLIACGGRTSGGDAADSGAAFRPLDVGAPVPAYAVASLGGDTIRLGGAGPVTILNVWATWCTSCREEMAALDSLQRELAPRGVRVVGVSVDEGSDELVRRFAAGNHLDFTVGHDPAARIQRSWQLVGVPTTFVVGTDGRLLWRHTGNIERLLDEVRAAAARGLATGSDASPTS